KANITKTNTWTVDTTPPSFDNCSNSSTNLGCNPTSIPVCDTGVTASDNCGSATVTCASDDAVSGCVHTRTLIYTATDGCLNTATCTNTITWTVDITPGPQD